MHPVNHDHAQKDPTAHRLLPGKGYYHLGTPKMPPKPVAGAKSCLPTAFPAPEGSWHLLKPPRGGAPVRFQWHPATQLWSPPLGSGKRLSFSAAYLAAHGWAYAGFI